MTYSLRFSRHLALRAVLAALTIAGGFTAATQAQTVKEVFSDEDLKEKKVEGEWTVIAAPDLKQLSDTTSPVAVSMVTSSAGRGKFLGLMKLPEVILDKRGDSALVSARLGWAVVPDGQEAALLEGRRPFSRRGSAPALRRKLTSRTSSSTGSLSPCSRRVDCTAPTA